MSNIICFVAHPDDAVVGMGGTLAKLAEEKNKIIIVIFSYGVKSHPHFKEDIIAKKRADEVTKVDELLGRESIFLGLKEFNFKKNIEELNIKDKIKNIIMEYNPEKIFTLSNLDPHPDHRSVNKVVMESIEEVDYKKEFYTFEVWNIIKENKPKLYIDISNYFDKKIKALKMFKSQKMSLYTLFIPVYLRNFLDGRKSHCKYAERFYRIK